MTKEEAQEILQSIKHYLTAGNPVWHKEVVAEALDIAIESITQDSTQDLISRRDAIDAMDKLWGDIKRTHKRVAKGHEAVYLDMRGTIKTLPSADRPTGWIPCSERLPNESGKYLVRPSDGVLEDYSDFSEVMIMPYDADCEAFGWWIEQYDPISLGFVDSDFNEFEVIAWMPLPEPYREDGEE